MHDALSIHTISISLTFSDLKVCAVRVTRSHTMGKTCEHLGTTNLTAVRGLLFIFCYVAIKM